MDLKSPIKWLGSKNRLLPKIYDNIDIDTIEKIKNGKIKYFEPFFGSGTFFFSLKPKIAILNDLNTNIIYLYNTIKDKKKLGKLHNLLSTLDKNYYKNEFLDRKKFFFNIRDEFNKEKNKEMTLKKLSYFVFLTNRCFNAIFKTNKEGNTIVGFGEVEGAKRKNTIDKEKLININNYFNNESITFFNNDFDEVIRKSKIKRGDFIYLDPPYISLDNKNSFTMYDKNDFSWEDNIRLRKLVDWLSRKGVLVLMSNHNSTLVRDLYSKYKIIPIKVNRFVSGRAGNKIMEEYNEVLIKNY